MSSLIRSVIAAGAVAAPGCALSGPSADLAQALRLDEVVAIMAEEGLAQGEELEADLLQGAGGAGWARVVRGIHDVPELTEQVTGDFVAAMEADAAARLLPFFTSEPGQTIVALELEARRAMLDPKVETAARDMAARLPAPRRRRIEAFIDGNDLLERNVAGAMNSSIAFYTGLAQGDAFGGGLEEEGIIAEVWAQEPDIRQETRDWLLAFLGLAYAPLEDETFDAYIAVSESAAGRTMNAALFEAFDAMFEDVSLQLGQAAAAFMQGSEL